MDHTKPLAGLDDLAKETKARLLKILWVSFDVILIHSDLFRRIAAYLVAFRNIHPYVEIHKLF